MRLTEKLVKILILIVKPPQSFRDNLRPPVGVSRFKWYFLILKKFFDTGLAVTNYAKYVIAIFGFTSNNVKLTMMIAGGYSIFCLWLGYVWYLWQLTELENEIGNRFNWFIQEVRDMKKHIEK